MSAKPEGTVACDGEEVGEWETFHWLSSNTHCTSQERSSSPASSVSSMSSSSQHELNNRFRSRTLGLRHHSEPKSIIFN